MGGTKKGGLKNENRKFRSEKTVSLEESEKQAAGLLGRQNDRPRPRTSTDSSLIDVIPKAKGNRTTTGTLKTKSIITTTSTRGEKSGIKISFREDNLESSLIETPTGSDDWRFSNLDALKHDEKRSTPLTVYDDVHKMRKKLNKRIRRGQKLYTMDPSPDLTAVVKKKS